MNGGPGYDPNNPPPGGGQRRPRLSAWWWVAAGIFILFAINYWAGNRALNRRHEVQVPYSPYMKGAGGAGVR